MSPPITPPDHRRDDPPAPQGWALLLAFADKILACRARTRHLIALLLAAAVPLGLVVLGIALMAKVGSWGGVVAGGGLSVAACRLLVRRSRR